HPPQLALVVAVLEQPAARQALQRGDDAAERPGHDLALKRASTLAGECQRDDVAAAADVALGQGGGPATATAVHVVFAADADVGAVDQHHHSGQHALPRQACQPEVARDSRPDAPQHAAKVDELRALAPVA